VIAPAGPHASARNQGVPLALLSAVLFGLTPILGKLALRGGVAPLPLVGARTVIAAALLTMLVVGVRRSDLAIYPIGLAGCLLAGSLNGLGSLLYYLALDRIDAGVGQMLFSLYPVFVAGFLFLDGQRPSRGTLLRLGLSLPAVYLLAGAHGGTVELEGVLLMLGAAALYGLHIPVNQRVLYEVPARTVTVYTLLAMTAVVAPIALIADPRPVFPTASLPPLAALAAVTFVSRLSLFAGVKSIGGMQTSLVGLVQLGVAVLLSQGLLQERLTALQALGGMLLVVVLLFPEGSRPRSSRTHGWLRWIEPPALQALSPLADPPEPPSQ
jgi:drug/metabolite transporter (DMT)-like permease